MELVSEKMQCAIVTATQPLVDALLALNTHNRAVQKRMVLYYRSIIKRGNWVPTNQGIGVSSAGALIDGQHRLLAIRAEGYPPVSFVLVVGLSDAALAAVDTGASRSAKDILQLMFNTQLSSKVAATLRTILCAGNNWDTRKYDPMEYADALELYGRQLDAILKIAGARELATPILAALTLAHLGNESAVEQFTASVVSGVMLEKDDPALLLRNWIAANKGALGLTGARLRFEKASRAVQAHIDGQKMTRLFRGRAVVAPQIGGREVARH